MSKNAVIGWLAQGTDEEHSFVKVEVLESDNVHRKVKLLEGPNKGAEQDLPAVGIPYEGVYPPLFIKDTKPDVFRFEGRILELYKPTKEEEVFVPAKEPYFFREWTKQVIDGINNHSHTLVVGPKGGGKTSCIEQVAAERRQPCIRVNLTGQVSISDLVGAVGFGKTKEGVSGTTWNDGPLVRCMRNGWWLILDEIDFCDPAVASLFFPILEGFDPAHGKFPKLCLKEKDGEVVVAHQNFRVFATGNSIGGDQDGKYVGTNPMNAALLDRFAGHGQIIRVEKVTIREEREILKDAMPHLPDSLRKRATNFGAKLRADLVPDFSTRVLLNFCRQLLLYKNAATAARLTLIGTIDDQKTREAILDLVKSSFGSRIMIGRGGWSAATETEEGEEGSSAPKIGRTAGQITDEKEIKAICLAHKDGKTFEQVEAVPEFGLRKSKGMNAWRIIKNHGEKYGVTLAKKAPAGEEKSDGPDEGGDKGDDDGIADEVEVEEEEETEEEVA